MKQRVRIKANGSPPPEMLLQVPFLEQVKERPDHLAIVTPSISLTYGEIYTRSNQLGHVLRNLGVQPNMLVAVVMEKGWEQVVGALGILQAGAAWMPLSPDISRDQLWYLLENEKVNLALTQSPLAAKLEWPPSTPCIPVDYYELNEAPAIPLEQVQKTADLAYMLPIQASAGTFSGIMTSHQGAVNTIADISRVLVIDHRDTIFTLSPPIDDLWAYTIFGTLAAGGTLIIPGPDNLQAPCYWEEQLNKTQATVWSSTPAVLSTFLKFLQEQGRPLPGKLRSILLSEGTVPASLPGQIKSFAKSVQVIRLDGVTR